MSTNEAYAKIMQTAWPVAYARTFSDIPYTKEVFQELLSLRGIERSELYDETQIRVSLAPQFEARHKLIDQLLKEADVHQILELASGLSTRGLIWTGNPAITYVETDLPDMVREKENIVTSLISKGTLPARPNLHFAEANALSFAELKLAIAAFKQEPLAVIHEGLLRYLDFSEKQKVAENVHALLSEFGGVWITSDISLAKIIAKDAQTAQRRLGKISGLTGRDIARNLFKDVDHARSFFEDLGFSVESHGFSEVAQELVSPQALSLDHATVSEQLGTAVVFVMRLK